jgi:hypothetical protein
MSNYREEIQKSEREYQEFLVELERKSKKRMMIGIPILAALSAGTGFVLFPLVPALAPFFPFIAIGLGLGSWEVSKKIVK